MRVLIGSSRWEYRTKDLLARKNFIRLVFHLIYRKKVRSFLEIFKIYYIVILDDPNNFQKDVIKEIYTSIKMMPSIFARMLTYFA